MRLSLGGREPFRLETARLVLRDPQPGDAFTWHADPRYLACYDQAPDSDAILATCRAWAREVPRTRFQPLVVLDGRVIGCVGVRQVEPGVADIGGELDPEFWRQGYISEALSALMEHARGRGIERFLGETRNPLMVRLCVNRLGMRVVREEAGTTWLAGS